MKNYFEAFNENNHLVLGDNTFSIMLGKGRLLSQIDCETFETTVSGRKIKHYILKDIDCNAVCIACFGDYKDVFQRKFIYAREKIGDKYKDKVGIIISVRTPYSNSSELGEYWNEIVIYNVYISSDIDADKRYAEYGEESETSNDSLFGLRLFNEFGKCTFSTKRYSAKVIGQYSADYETIHNGYIDAENYDGEYIYQWFNTNTNAAFPDRFTFVAEEYNNIVYGIVNLCTPKGIYQSAKLNGPYYQPDVKTVYGVDVSFNNNDFPLNKNYYGENIYNNFYSFLCVDIQTVPMEAKIDNQYFPLRYRSDFRKVTINKTDGQLIVVTVQNIFPSVAKFNDIPLVIPFSENNEYYEIDATKLVRNTKSHLISKNDKNVDYLVRGDSKITYTVVNKPGYIHGVAKIDDDFLLGDMLLRDETVYATPATKIVDFDKRVQSKVVFEQINSIITNSRYQAFETKNGLEYMVLSGEDYENGISIPYYDFILDVRVDEDNRTAVWDWEKQDFVWTYNRDYSVPFRIKVNNKGMTTNIEYYKSTPTHIVYKPNFEMTDNYCLVLELYYGELLLIYKVIDSSNFPYLNEFPDYYSVDNMFLLGQIIGYMEKKKWNGNVKFSSEYEKAFHIKVTRYSAV